MREKCRTVTATLLTLHSSLPRLNVYNHSMPELGKMLVALGVVLLVVGLLFIALGRTHLPLGRLPGDIFYRGKNTTFYFPIMTSIVVSVLLSIILYLIGRFRR
jgi:Protein of unknown function (DUF2905)